MCKKGRVSNDSALERRRRLLKCAIFNLSFLTVASLLLKLPPCICSEPDQSRGKKEYGGGFRHGHGNRVAVCVESLERSPISPTIIGGYAAPTIAMMMMASAPQAISIICHGEDQNSTNNKFPLFHRCSPFSIHRLLHKELFPPISCEPKQSRPKKEHGGGLRDSGGRSWGCSWGVVYKSFAPTAGKALYMDTNPQV